MTRFVTTVGLGLVIPMVGIGLPSPVFAYPLSGTYQSAPGSTTSQGAFSTTGILLVNEVNATATFQVGVTVYNGSFVDPVTLHITRCSAAPVPPSSERVDWTFHFDTNSSFAWTGTTRTFSNSSCSGVLLSLIDFTNVSMARVAEPDPLAESGLYETFPGSSTSQGPFSTIGVLTVNEADATATFQIGSTIYSGDFISDTTLEFNGCVALGAGGPQSESVHWTFEFDTPHSFYWTGTSTFHVQPSCIIVESVLEYTNVRMGLSGTVGVQRMSWGAVKSMYR